MKDRLASTDFQASGVKKKEKENQETESQDHVGVRPRKVKTILNWASKFLRYSVPQIHFFIIV